MVFFHSYVSLPEGTLLSHLLGGFPPPIYSNILQWTSEFFWIVCGFVEIFAASPIFKRCEEYKIDWQVFASRYVWFDSEAVTLFVKKNILYVMICGVWRCQPCVNWYQPINHPLFWIFWDNFLEYLNVVGFFGPFSRVFDIFGPIFDKLSCGFQHTPTHPHPLWVPEIIAHPAARSVFPGSRGNLSVIARAVVEVRIDGGYSSPVQSCHISFWWVHNSSAS